MLNSRDSLCTFIVRGILRNGALFKWENCRFQPNVKSILMKLITEDHTSLNFSQK